MTALFRILMLLSSISLTAFAGPSSPVSLNMRMHDSDFFITVSNPEANQAWSAKQCELAGLGLRTGSSIPQCALSADVEKVFNAKISHRFKYRVSIEKRADDSIAITFDNWNSKNDSNVPEHLGWIVHAAPQTEQNLYVEKIVRGLRLTLRSLRFQREALLLLGIKESTAVEFNREDGKYYKKAKNTPIEFEDAYELFQSEKPRNKHYLRAGIEVMTGLLGGTVWYWSNADFNSVDWELHSDWSTWRKKLLFSLETTSFDTNKNFLNSVKHPLCGMYYYTSARSNNLNILESALFALIGSTTWEFVVEFREKVSINDQFLTTGGGIVMGEVFSHLGNFFDRSKNTLANVALAHIFGSPRKFNDWLDKNKPRRIENFDSFGFSTEVWHEFNLSAGYSVSDVSDAKTREDVELSLQTEIVDIPIYKKQGQAAKFLYDGNFTKLVIKSSFGEEGLRDFLLFTRTSLAGYYRQDMRNDKSHDLRGYSLFVGLASAYEYSLHAKAVGARDMFGVVNILGPTVELVGFYKGFKIRAVVDVFGDFAILRSYAIDEFFEHNTGVGTKATLGLYGHYFAFGVTAAPKITVSYGGVEVGGEMKVEYFDSIEGWDRYQAEIKNDVLVTDRRSQTRAWVAYAIPDLHLKVSAALEHLSREGTAESNWLDNRALTPDDFASSSREETTFMGNVILLF